MKFHKSVLALFCLCLSACTAPQPANDGYFPIPEKFTGTWVRVSIVNDHTPMAITQTPTGAIITETMVIKGKNHKGIESQREIPLKIFAIQGDRIYAVGQSRLYDLNKNGKEKRSSYFPQYFSLEYTPPDQPFDSYGTTLYFQENYCFTQSIKQEDLEKPASFHLQNISKESCNKSFIKPESWTGDFIKTIPYHRYHR